ncbi:hypothetical protein B566_EDAN007942 [Ephemera danica]|nr:hypothetical protein B566_EDAN007942 [Ephemera danica]
MTFVRTEDWSLELEKNSYRPFRLTRYLYGVVTRYMQRRFKGAKVNLLKSLNTNRRVKMWITGKVDLTNQKDILFNDLFQECKHAAPGARLSYQMRNRLERFQREDRREIVTRTSNGCAPLFIACKRGHLEIVEYLISVCDADVEQRGLYEVPDDRSVHCVTPLWCAAVSGRLSIIKCLISHGADINAVSDTGSTPVRSACFMTHLEIVTYLVENGADILRANYNGGTCLINSVQSVELCRFLLKHGAEVNTRDIQHKTALHYAIQEHRLETTMLLITSRANPHLRSRYHDDALQTACLKGATQIFEYLLIHVKYSYHRIAEAYELIGSTFLDEHNDTQMALLYWSRATEFRTRAGLFPKQHAPHNGLCGTEEAPHSLQPSSSQAAYHNMTEFQTEEELRNIALDVDDMRIQSLLVCERILGTFHKDMLFRLMYRGAAYADALQYQRCIDLWRYALEVRVAKDSILYNDTCFTAQALVRLYLDLHERSPDNRQPANGGGGVQGGPFIEDLRFSDVMATASLLTRQLSESQVLLSARPVHKRQQDSFDRVLKCLTHLFHLLLVTAKTSDQLELTRLLVRQAVHSNPRSSQGDTLLHLAVSRSNTIRSSYFLDDNAYVFPNLLVTKLLMECGAPVNALNHANSTPLHFAAHPTNFTTGVVQFLLDHGAHLDQQNSDGEQPLHLLAANPNSTIPLLRYTTLRCLAAVVVSRHKIPYAGAIPTTLEGFVQSHHI